MSLGSILTDWSLYGFQMEKIKAITLGFNKEDYFATISIGSNGFIVTAYITSEHNNKLTNFYNMKKHTEEVMTQYCEKFKLPQKAFNDLLKT
jgi:hypothetical protein